MEYVTIYEMHGVAKHSFQLWRAERFELHLPYDATLSRCSLHLENTLRPTYKVVSYQELWLTTPGASILIYVPTCIAMDGQSLSGSISVDVGT